MSQTADLAIGIDIGGTNTVFGVVDKKGSVVERGTIQTNKHDLIEDYIDELYLAVLPLIEYAGGVNRIKGIGIGAPNGNYYKGTIEHAPNLKWKGVIPFAKLVEEKFNIRVILTNDANAAAIGEHIYGAARNMKDFIMVTLGTGVGGGIVANNSLIYGHDGFAGELGHNIVIPNGRYHPNTGSYGCLEMYASASGLTRTAIEMIESDTERTSLLHEFAKEEINSKVVYECAMKDDALSKEVYSYTGKILGMALANFAMFSSPEAIILFGGLTKAGDLIMKPTIDSFNECILPLFRGRIEILISELFGADAAILGASALVWKEV